MKMVLLLSSPVSLGGLFIGYFVIVNPPPSETGIEVDLDEGKKSFWRQIDISGSILLVIGLSVQLAALSLGGNQYSWSDFRVIFSLARSFVIPIIFVVVELKTKALPIMLVWMRKGRAVISNTISNILVGMTAFAVRLPTQRTTFLADPCIVSLYSAAILSGCAS